MRCAITLFVPLMLLAGCSGKEEPLISHDKPVDHWLQELKKPDVKSRKTAVVALGHVGTADSRAIPALIEAVRGRGVAGKDPWSPALPKLGPNGRGGGPGVRGSPDGEKSTAPFSVMRTL